MHSGNEPLLIAGVGTETLEILEEQPETDVIVVPVGGGSGAAGACIVAKAINPAIRVIGVQSDAAPAAFRSWQARRLVEDKMETCAEGLATRTAFELPQQILWRWLDDFVLVSDDEIRAAQALMIEATRNLVEAAGAAPLAAASAPAGAADREARRDDLEWRQRQPRAACGGAIGTSMRSRSTEPASCPCRKGLATTCPPGSCPGLPGAVGQLSQ